MQDYTDADIIENMGDVDFANDFAEMLLGDLTNLKAECKKVSDDCIQRKRALENALVGLELDGWDAQAEESVVELDAGLSNE